MDSTKYIFVTGGVVSSLGKGIVSSSLAALLQARGYSVTIQKLDPYINIDPGTLNPYEHGEVYVTEDGTETDLDLGHYERFLDIPTGQANNVTTGRIYSEVIRRERMGEYHGKTVQVVPHVTDEIKRRIGLLSRTGKYQIVVTEIGGTVGDIESLPFIEAARQMHYELGRSNVIFIHLTLVPFVGVAGELKTKPTQHSVKQLLEYGVQADVLVCRTEHSLSADLKAKIALFCNVEPHAVIEAKDARTIYEVPLLLKKQAFDKVVLQKLNLKLGKDPVLSDWKAAVELIVNPERTVNVALVGKYAELPDAYKSILEAFVHAGVKHRAKVEVSLIQSDELTENNVTPRLQPFDGILVAPGFGVRGIPGKLAAIRYAREHGVPFLGICLGMQMAVVEFARNVLQWTDADSAEMNPNTSRPVVALMESQADVKQLGGTMRLGAFDCRLADGTLARQIYGQERISERHRHRYEFNNAYRTPFIAAGMIPSGLNPEHDLVEIVEIPAHPFFIATQFHPEYKSTLKNPHPLFLAFVRAALQRQSARPNPSLTPSPTLMQPLNLTLKNT
jgi:CTP synthase